MINELLKKVLKERIFYINFEDERFEKNILMFIGLILIIEEFFGILVEFYFFFDEI